MECFRYVPNYLPSDDAHAADVAPEELYTEEARSLLRDHVDKCTQQNPLPAEYTARADVAGFLERILRATALLLRGAHYETRGAFLRRSCFLFSVLPFLRASFPECFLS